MPVGEEPFRRPPAPGKESGKPEGTAFPLMTPTLSSVTIRAPWPDEMPRLKQFLRGSMRLVGDLHLFALVADAPERLVGAAALAVSSPGQGNQPSRAAKLIMKLRPRALSEGYGATLLNSVLTSAKALGCERVSVETGEGETLAALFEAFEFKPKKTEELWQLDLRKVQARLDRLANRIGTPSDWILRMPVEQDLPRLRELAGHYQFRQADQIRFDRPHDLPGTFYKPEFSAVVEHHGRIIAAMLAKASTGLNGHVDIRLVAPEVRTESARLNFLLLGYSLPNGIREGYETTTLTVNVGRDRETRNLAQRTGGRLLQRTTVSVREL